MRRLRIALVVPMLFLTSCQASQDEAPMGSTPAATPAVVLFQDNFSDPVSGWDRINDLTGMTDYVSGVYRIKIAKPNIYLWARPKLQFQDLRLEVMATPRSKDGISGYGVICRYLDPQNFYFFTITSDGFYGVSKFKDGRELLVDMQMWQSNPAIRQGNVTNQLGVDCVGDQLRLYVNGSLLIQVEDGDFNQGDVGLIMTALSGDGGEVDFDNLTVIQP